MVEQESTPAETAELTASAWLAREIAFLDERFEEKMGDADA